uniref:G_PROTEIN_RECEP_F1_2 domain-containing protein n=1 Tax=Steinernema glaseri TaxID=37863 RepID=A0A1I8A7K8_9BILA
MVPYCTPNGSLSLDPKGEDGGIQGAEQFAKNIGLLYVLIGFLTIPLSCFVLFVFTRPHLFKHSCYKIMSLNTIMDIVNLTNGCLFTGVFSIQNIHHCNSGVWVNYFVHYILVCWLSYCAASMVLALNRMLEFANKHLSDFLFTGKRAYFWFFAVFTYGFTATFFCPHKFYFYNTYGGHWAIFSDNDRTNMLLVINNFFKPAFLAFAYAVMLFFMYRRLRTSEGAKISSFQVKVSIQALATAILADCGSIGYVVISSVSFAPAIANYAGFIGELLWISLHAGTGVIYLTMNSAVKQRLKSTFCAAPQISPSEITNSEY